MSDSPPRPEAPYEHSGHSHSHRAGSSAHVSRRVVRLTMAALVPAALATLVGLILLWPGDVKPAGTDDGALRVEADVVTVHERACPPLPQGGDIGGPAQAATRCGEVVVRLNEGPDRGKRATVEMPSGPGAPVVEAGDKVITVRTESFNQPGTPVYEIVDHERSTGVWALGLAFALAVVAFGRWRGLSALAGLAITFAILLMFIVPAILQGSPPLLVAIVGSAAIMLVVLYLTHGFSIPTSMAVLGTLASLTLTGVLAAFTTSALKLTGVASEESAFLTMQHGNVNMLGLLLAGVLIGSLGVLDDVAVTQSYTVTELAQANPDMGFAALYQAASRVGRAHITSVINTIVLAYAGASLPLMLLLSANNSPFWPMVTTELITQEIVRSAVGTMGLIAAVPITTALAALAARGSAGKARPSPRVRPRRPDPLDPAWRVPEDDHQPLPDRQQTRW